MAAKPLLSVRALVQVLAVAGVPAHAHCEMCQTPVVVGDRLCGTPECKEKFDAGVRAKKRGMYLFIGVIFAAVLLSKLL